jgi:hypothetical protein
MSVCVCLTLCVDFSLNLSFLYLSLPQVLKVEQLNRGCLELGFNIKISLGRLAKYTKVSIVYFTLFTGI